MLDIPETLCVYDVYEVTRREKLYEAHKPNRQLPCNCTFCGCWSIQNFLTTRFYKEDVVLLDNNSISIEATASEEFKTEILKLRSVIRFMDGTTIHVNLHFELGLPNCREKPQNPQKVILCFYAILNTRELTSLENMEQSGIYFHQRQESTPMRFVMKCITCFLRWKGRCLLSNQLNMR